MKEIVHVQEASLAIPVHFRADQNPALIYIAHFAEGSRRTMREALQIIADLVTNPEHSLPFDEFPWHLLRTQHTAKIRADLIGRYSPAMTKKCLSALRGVLKHCWRLEMITAEERERAIDFERIEGKRLPAGRALSREEVDRLLSAVDSSTAIGIRDRSIAEFLYSTGCRREEASSALLQRYNREERRLVLRGKRNKDREVNVSPSLSDSLDTWLEVRGTSPGTIFCHVTKGGMVHPDLPLSANSIYAILMKLAAKADVQDISPHDFRRTFISDAIDAGVDIATVAEIVGHDDVKTTQKYDRRGERTRQKAVDLLDKARGR